MFHPNACSQVLLLAEKVWPLDLNSQTLSALTFLGPSNLFLTGTKSQASGFGIEYYLPFIALVYPLPKL